MHCICKCMHIYIYVYGHIGVYIRHRATVTSVFEGFSELPQLLAGSCNIGHHPKSSPNLNTPIAVWRK